MPEALALVKKELGPEAIILGTRALSASGIKGLVGRERFEITATRTTAGRADSASRATHASQATQASRATLASAASNRTPTVREGQASRETAPSGAPTVRERVFANAQRPLPHGRGSDQEKNPLPYGRGSADCDLSARGSAGCDLSARGSADCDWSARGSDARARPTSIPPAVRPHYESLVRAEVEEELAARIIQSAIQPGEPLSPTRVQSALRGVIATLVPTVGGIELKPRTTRRVALIGPPGVGKTTTIAKLAAHFKLKAKCNVALLSIDTYRPAAHDQLKRYAELIGVPVYQAQTGSGVRAALKEIGNVDLVLIDTPGVGGRDRGRFARLAALLRAARPDELHLALSASLAQKVQDEAIRVFSPLGPTRLLLTRLDEAVGLGAILGVIRRVDWQMSYLTSGQRVPADIEEFRHERLAELIVASASA